MAAALVAGLVGIVVVVFRRNRRHREADETQPEPSAPGVTPVDQPPAPPVAPRPEPAGAVEPPAASEEPAPPAPPTGAVPQPPVPAPARHEDPAHATQPRWAAEPASAPVPPAELLEGAGSHADDPQLQRAAAAAERALSLLRTFRSSCQEPIPRALAVAIEGAASAWFEDNSLTPFEVMRLLDPQRRDARPISRGAASGLEALLDSAEGSVWDLALRFAAHLGAPAYETTPESHTVTSPNSLLDEMVAAVVVSRSPQLGRFGRISGRAIVASWPVRAWRLDSIPLIISPSLSAADALFDDESEMEAAVLALLTAVEDAALRMLRAEQAVADLHRRYLDELNSPRPAPTGRGRHAKTAAVADDPGRRSHGRVVTELFLHPVLTIASVTAHLVDADDQQAQALISDLEERGWVRRVGQRSDATDDEVRWVAGQIIDVVTRPFHGDYSPRDPNPIDHPGVRRRAGQKVR